MLSDFNRTHIQLLRGIAIVAVVMIHNTPLGLCQVFVRPFLNFAVGLFLFLSGMLSDTRKWNPKKRFTKVLIPYIIWTVIYTVLNNTASFSAIPLTLAKNLITGNAASIMYYIFVYCQFTLLIPLIDKLARSKFRYAGFLIAPIEIIFMRTIPMMTELYTFNNIINLVRGLSCLGWFTYFYLGYLMGNDLIKVKKSNKLWCGLLIAGILLEILEGYLQYSHGVVDCGHQLKLSTLFTDSCITILAFNFIHSKKAFNSKLLEFLGNNSFGIYFSHRALMTVLSWIPYYSAVIFPLNVIIVLIINIIFIIVVKKIFGRFSKYLAL